MGLYQDWVVPTLIDLSMRNKRLRPYRERVAGAAAGGVLDVGIGSDVNLPLYGQAHEVFGLDPSSGCWHVLMIRRSTREFPSTCSKAQPNPSRWQTTAWILWS
jgi:hypothetical protein